MSGLDVLFATSEMLPLAKTGGLADVSASLPRALAALGHRVRVMLPGYPAVRDALRRGSTLGELDLEGEPVAVIGLELDGLEIVTIADPELDRPGGPYVDEHGESWPDNARRFGRFCKGIAQLVAADGALAGVQVLHLNDWQTGLAAPLARSPGGPAIVFTIHNLGYPGVFDRAAFDELRLPDSLWSIDGLEFHGQFSFLKGGLAFADRVSTVSPTYAREIMQPQLGFGFDGLLRYRSDRVSGILNGIDTALWDPAADRAISYRYDAAHLPVKPLNKDRLRNELRLRPDEGPLLGTIGRLVSQKGIDLIAANTQALVASGAQLIVLGEGDAAIEDELRGLAARFRGSVAAHIGFDEALAHRIEAGADIFLMPSRFEPCGLNQMYSMRYGTLPLVRATGGLADSVTDAAEPDGTGFVFARDEEFLPCVERALATYRDAPAWAALQTRAMARDDSWADRAEQYVALYRQALADAAVR